MAKKKSKGAVDFHWNFKNSVIIERKGFGKELNKEIAEIFKRHMDKYVPYDSLNTTNMHLATMVQARGTKDHGTVVYSMNYAPYQYRGGGADISPNGGRVSEVWKRDRSTHPLSTSYWDKVCWVNEKSQILNEVEQKRKKISRKRQ